jgi:hypothetical protein
MRDRNRLGPQGVPLGYAVSDRGRVARDHHRNTPRLRGDTKLLLQRGPLDSGGIILSSPCVGGRTHRTRDIRTVRADRHRSHKPRAVPDLRGHRPARGGDSGLAHCACAASHLLQSLRPSVWDRRDSFHDCRMELREVDQDAIGSAPSRLWLGWRLCRVLSRDRPAVCGHPHRNHAVGRPLFAPRDGNQLARRCSRLGFLPSHFWGRPPGTATVE